MSPLHNLLYLFALPCLLSKLCLVNTAFLLNPGTWMAQPADRQKYIADTRLNWPRDHYSKKHKKGPNITKKNLNQKGENKKNKNKKWEKLIM